jgi:hypothetical protein
MTPLFHDISNGDNRIQAGKIGKIDLKKQKQLLLTNPQIH